LVHQIAEVGVVIHFFDGLFGPCPKAKERTVVLDRAAGAVAVSDTLHRVQRAFDQADDLPHGSRGGIPGEQIAALNPAALLDEPGGSQLVEDILEEPLGYGLISRDLADGDGSFAMVFGKFENGAYRVLAFLREIHVRLLSTSGFQSFIHETIVIIACNLH
jgi:hypothetical protein